MQPEHANLRRPARMDFHVEVYDAHGTLLKKECIGSCVIPAPQGPAPKEPVINPATEKQVEYLRRLGVEVAPELSRQVASNLIDQALKGEARGESESGDKETEVLHLPRRIP